MKHGWTAICWTLLLALPGITTTAEALPHFATGFKIGEVTATGAVLWCRTTRDAERVGGEAVPNVSYRSVETGELSEEQNIRHTHVPVVTMPEGHTVETLEGAVPGVEGRVRVRYRAEGEETWRETPWVAVDPLSDYTQQISLDQLLPGQPYNLIVEASAPDSDAVTATMDGTFRTAPAADSPERVLFTVTTGQMYEHMDLPEGFAYYASMLKLQPSFFVHTGDVLYYDKLAKTRDLALWHWQRMYSLPTNMEFHRRVPSYFIKDDHDVWQNDCWPQQESHWMGTFTFAEGLRIFPKQVPSSPLPYRTFRWGRDLQIWVVEGRDYRSSNPLPDGPGKTIWGTEQKQWFKETVAASDATFRVLISPTPLIGPDRGNKNDNHANAGFATEGNELRQFMAGQKNMVVICGDRHWQYVTEHAETGLWEYSAGPASDQHAGGWSMDQRLPEHRYLNVIGGFLAVTVERREGQPVMVLRHHGVDGRILNEDIRTSR
jgi:alkaline phosphatase D